MGEKVVLYGRKNLYFSLRRLGKSTKKSVRQIIADPLNTTNTHSINQIQPVLIHFCKNHNFRLYMILNHSNHRCTTFKQTAICN